MAAITLDDRVALGGEETYGWIHWVAGAYCVIVGAFSALAYINEGHVFRAALCAGAQVLAIVCAILCRRALTAEMHVSAALCAIGTLGCAYWAALGIRHAWEANGEAISQEMVTFLAALEPGLFLLAEHIQEGRTARRAAVARAEREQAEALVQARLRDAALIRPPAATGDAFLRDLAKSAGGAVATMAALHGVAAASTSAPVEQPADYAPATAGATPEMAAQYEFLRRYDSEVAEAWALRHIQGMKRLDVAERMKRHKSTITRYWNTADEALRRAAARAA